MSILTINRTLKKEFTMKKITRGKTHSGIFHADEVFSSAILRKVFGDIPIIRTFRISPQDSEDDTTIVFDIGGGKYDHHQKGGNGCRENGVPYSSAGLIWRDFGRLIPEVSESANPDLVWSLIDRDLIQGIDAIDNGVMPKADFACKPMSISAAISGFNPTWDSNVHSDTAFMEAVEFATLVLGNALENAVSKAKAESIVEEAIAKTKGPVMVLEKFAPWQEFIFSSENEKAKNILFVVFPSNRGGYNWQCVPAALGSFAQRHPVPQEWRGLSGKELQEVTGVTTATFCHPAGFIGGAETREDAIRLAEIASKS